MELDGSVGAGAGDPVADDAPGRDVDCACGTDSEDRSALRMMWIGVDFDHTLSKSGDPGDPVLPVPRMVERVRSWLAQGIEVRIVTARVADGFDPTKKDRAEVERFCIEHLGATLPIVSGKDPHMLELWDDKAVQVIPDSGMRADGKD